MKRREFVYKTILGSCGLAVATVPIITSCSLTGTGKKAIISLIGCGNRGKELLAILSGMDADFTIKQVCDVDAERGKAAVELVKELFGYVPDYLQDLQDVFVDEQVNVVIIATPGHWSTLAAMKACQAGKDVYLESIPGLSIGEGQKLIEAASNYSCALQLGYQDRSAPYCASARDYIESGELGQIVHVKVYNLMGGSKWLPLPDSSTPEGLDWNSWLGPAPYRDYNAGIHGKDSLEGWGKYWDYSEGPLAFKAGRLLDLARMLIGDPAAPRSVYCYGGNWAFDSEQEVPEMQIVTYDYESFTLTCESTSAMPYLQQSAGWKLKGNRIEIYGTKGLMFVGIDGDGWQVLGNDGVILASEQGSNPVQEHLQNFIEDRKSRDGLNAPVQQSFQSALLVHMANIAYRTGNSQLLWDSEKDLFIDHPQANEMINRVYREGFEIPEHV